jgi:hypothetical protein
MVFASPRRSNHRTAARSYRIGGKQVTLAALENYHIHPLMLVPFPHDGSVFFEVGTIILESYSWIPIDG